MTLTINSLKNRIGHIKISGCLSSPLIQLKRKKSVLSSRYHHIISHHNIPCIQCTHTYIFKETITHITHIFTHTHTSAHIQATVIFSSCILKASNCGSLRQCDFVLCSHWIWFVEYDDMKSTLNSYDINN